MKLLFDVHCQLQYKSNKAEIEKEYDLNRTDGQLEYYRAMVRVLETLSEEGHTELCRLKEKR